MRHKLNVCIQCSIFAAHCSLSLSLSVFVCLCRGCASVWLLENSNESHFILWVISAWSSCLIAFGRAVRHLFMFDSLEFDGVPLRFRSQRRCHRIFFSGSTFFFHPFLLATTHTHTRSHKFISEYNFRSKSFFFSFNFGKHHLMTQLPAECYNGYKITCGEVNRQWRA